MENKFTSSQVLKESYQIIKSNFWGIIGNFSLLFLVFIILSILSGEIFLLNFLVSSLASFAGVALCFIYANREEYSIDKLFDMFSFKKFIYFIASSLLLGLGFALGFILLIIPGVILVLKWCFAQYLIIDKTLSPIAAIKESSRITKGHRMKLLGFFALVFLINILGFICLGIGVLFTAPLTSIATVLIYKKLSSEAVPVKEEENKEEII